MRADDLAAPSGNSYKFDTVGDTVEGPISYIGEWQTQTNKFNGGTEDVCRIGVDYNGEPVYIWPRKGSSMAQAIANALRDANLPSLEVGQTLKLQYSENKDTGKPQPMKVFRARVTPPTPEQAAQQAAKNDPF